LQGDGPRRKRRAGSEKRFALGRESRLREGPASTR